MGEFEWLRSEQKKKTTSDDEEDRMTLAQLSRSRRNPTTPTPFVVSNRACTSSRQKQALSNHDKAKQCAKERAEEVQANLDPQFPSFLKIMGRSHVTGGFWLGLPAQFCHLHLPKHNVIVTLVDENQKEHFTKFLVEKTGLSAGWRGFSIAHELVEGEALVFHLVEDTKFQVYIVRAYNLGAIDGFMGLPNLDSHAKRTIQSKHIMTSEETARKRQNTVLLASFKPVKKELFGSGSEEVGAEVFEGNRDSKNTIEFKDVKNLETFTIVVNGVILDSEFSKTARTKYYKLCRSQDAFLHDNLREGMNMKFVAGAISETVDIADDMKAIRLSTSPDEFAAWDQSLEALEKLGMKVGFLRARLQRIIAFKSEAAADLKQCNESQVRRADVEEEIKTVKAKLAKLENSSKMLDFDIEALKANTRWNELKFHAEVDFPW